MLLDARRQAFPARSKPVRPRMSKMKLDPGLYASQRLNVHLCFALLASTQDNDRVSPTSSRNPLGLAIPRSQQVHRLFRATRWLATSFAAAIFSLSVLSMFAFSIRFGTDAFYVWDGRIMFHFPCEWADGLYCSDCLVVEGGPFPIDTDSLFGVITYWLPSDFSVSWRDCGDEGASPTVSVWLHPLCFGTDGEFGETGARPVPLSLLVYLTAPVAVAMWMPWNWRRKGHCHKCGYDLAGLVAADHSQLVCPECGTSAAAKSR